MPSLKDYRDRIASVKSTKKITSAMKMVAASKLKKAQDIAEASQPYATKMASILARLSANITDASGVSPLMGGTGKEDTHLLVVVTSDRGLCGGFNTAIIRETTRKIQALKEQGKEVKLIFVGRKGFDALKKPFAEMVVEKFPIMEGKVVTYTDASKVSEKVLELFEAGEFDVCTLVYNRFKSVISQIPSTQQLIPFKGEEEVANENKADGSTGPQAQYEFEPNEEEILERLLPLNLGTQTFRAMLDSAAGEQAARMTAMDNATRNAGEMIDSLTLQYNRARQAYITKELIEIISGAEAL